MNVHDYLSDDGQAMLLLCSSLALPPHAEETGVTPFKLSEWNDLARKIAGSPLKTPAALPGHTADELAQLLALTTPSGSSDSWNSPARYLSCSKLILSRVSGR
jgi:hypothetical protein